MQSQESITEMIKPKLFSPCLFVISLDTFHSLTKGLLNVYHMQGAMLGASTQKCRMQFLPSQHTQGSVQINIQVISSTMG